MPDLCCQQHGDYTANTSGNLCIACKESAHTCCCVTAVDHVLGLLGILQLYCCPWASVMMVLRSEGMSGSTATALAPAQAE